MNQVPGVKPANLNSDGPSFFIDKDFNKSLRFPFGQGTVIFLKII